MEDYLDAIAATVAKCVHAVLLVDRAEWHSTDKVIVPKKLSLVVLPFPELRPAENICQHLSVNWISKSVFSTHGLPAKAGIGSRRSPPSLLQLAL